MLMDDVQYGTDEIGQGSNGMMAIVDSANTSIQIPATQFTKLKNLMQKHDSTISVQTVDNQEILVSKKQCKDLFNVLGDLKFMLQHT